MEYSGAMKLTVLLVMLLVSCAEAQVRRAVVATDGRVHITMVSGREYIAAIEKSPYPLGGRRELQESVEAPVVAEDHRTVGWTVNFPNCCTSYPIPVTLVIYRDGRLLRRIRSHYGTPIYEWVFVEAGKKVAYHTETVHGGFGRQFELVDVSTGRLLDVWAADKKRKPPKWGRPFTKEMADYQ